METEVKFNLQRYLEDMRREQQEAHRDLSAKVDDAFSQLTKQGTRLTTVENSHRLVRWFGGVAIVGLVGFIFDVLLNHLTGAK